MGIAVRSRSAALEEPFNTSQRSQFSHSSVLNQNNFTEKPVFLILFSDVRGEFLPSDCYQFFCRVLALTRALYDDDDDHDDDDNDDDDGLFLL